MMLLTAIGGGFGAVCRFLLDSRLADRQWRTMRRLLLINVLGSVALGVVVGLCSSPGSQSWLLLLGTGFCGGFTTFSTAMVELASEGRKAELLYLLAMSALSLLGYFAALHLAA